MEDSLLEVVEGEVDLLKSAYNEDFTDLREKDAWKVSRAPEVQLTLGPHHSTGGTLHRHVRIVLRIKTTDRYPHEPAEVNIENYDGLSAKKVRALENQLKRKAVDFAQGGLVVMLELCQVAQSYLSEHARPYNESIYEEMVAGQEARKQATKEAEEEKQRLKEKWEEEQRSVLRVEVARVEEELREEERQRRQLRLKPTIFSEFGPDKTASAVDKDTPGRPLKCRSISECSSENGSGENLGNHVLRFSLSGKQERVLVVVGCIWERKSQGCFLFEARDGVTFERSVIYEWRIKSKRIGKKKNHLKVGEDNQLEELASKFSTTEKEASTLLRLSHENLVGYLGMKVNHQPGVGIDVYIVQEYVHGTSMKYYVDHQLPLNEALLRHITEGTLKALIFLHQNNVVHRDLRDSSIYLDNLTHLVRIADYGVERKIVEAVEEYKNNTVPVVYPMSPGRGGKKGDVYRLGLVILSIHSGRRVQEMVPALPPNLSSECRSFLQKCLALNEQERWTVEKLLSHPFIQSSGETARGNNKRRGSPGKYDDDKQDDEEDSSRSEAGGLDMASQLLPSLKKGSLGLRIENEYKIQEFLGKGGFGHVFKVQNKIDDRVYAVKRIPLHEQSEPVRKKIIREVKLLSSLNHENVVRYYTSWIEELEEDVESNTLEDESSSGSQDTTRDITVSSIKTNGSSEESSSSFGPASDFSVPVAGVESEWSIVFCDEAEKSGYPQAGESDDESEDDDDDWLMGSLGPMLQDEESDSEDERKRSRHALDADLEVDGVDGMDDTDGNKKSASEQLKKQYLFIQMQLCEKNTLRQVINEHLHMDIDRMWRLFREIVNGLDYIHAQGLIHRDLKPGNIFLDSEDRVKIGDFGLATAAIKAKTTVGAIKMDVEDSALTGQIGTTFYVAPEVTKATGKVNYTGKVDIYSLGVIFFEMVYPPLTTGMERAKILFELRKPDVNFPSDMKEKNHYMKLIKWLLQHDPQQRPSTTDILNSPLIPPPTAEEQKFIQTLESKLENVRSSDYQEILTRVFTPSGRPELEATFELRQPTSSDYWQYWKLDYLHSLVSAVFKAHGGIWVPTSFYVPRGSFYNDKDNLVSLMSWKGELVSAQYELRYPFARFLARNDVKHMRRYCIDRVQRAIRVSGLHPRESYECAFDIVSPKKDAVESCARVLLLVHDIVRGIIQARSENVLVRLGHMELVCAILTHCSIEESLQPKVVSLLKEYHSKRMPLENLGEFLEVLGLSKSSLESLRGFLLLDGPLDDVLQALNAKGLTSRRKNLVSKIKLIYAELREIVEAAGIFGVKFQISVCPLMVADAQLYCGFMCQFLLNVKKKRSVMQELLAQGGSYEKLITEHRRKLLDRKTTKDSVSAVGVSLFLEKFVSCVNEAASSQQLEAELGCGGTLVDVMVCAVGSSKLLQERVNIMLLLRKAKLTADHCHCQTQEEAEAIAEDYRVENLVLLMGCGKAAVRLRVDATGRVLERKIAVEEVVDFVVKNLAASEASVVESKRIETKPISVNPTEEELKVIYVTRRHCKNRDAGKKDEQITREVRAAVSRWPDTGPRVEVLAVELDRKPMLALGSLDVESTNKNFTDSLADVKNTFPDQKDYLEEIGKLLHVRIFPRKKCERCCVVLYSLTSNTFKRIL